MAPLAILAVIGASTEPAARQDEVLRERPRRRGRRAVLETYAFLDPVAA